jgi:carbamoyl-phosphate synthase large subunit
MLGASPQSIELAEDREKFKAVIDRLDLGSAKSSIARSLEDGKRILQEIGLPLILRPSFTLGGEGGGAAKTESEFLAKLERALFLSPTGQCLVEEDLTGWKEFELEVGATMSSSSAPSKTSIPWESTPETASRWRPHRH